MSRRAFPYPRPEPEAIQAGQWVMETEDGPLPLPRALPDWDYRMDLHLTRRVTVDTDRVRHRSGLAPDAPLTLACVWTASGSGLRGAADRVRIDHTGLAEVELRARLAGAGLGGVLDLDTRLVLARNRTDGAPWAPRRAGSSLWEDHRSLRLQGDAPQFPMAVVDFAETSFPDGAGWHLQIGVDLHAAAMGSLLLLINEGNRTVTEAFTRAARPRPVDRVVLSAVHADVARVMIEHALAREDFVDGAEFPEDSLGAVLASLFGRLFGNQTINDVRLRSHRSPALFASEVQAATRIFGET